MDIKAQAELRRRKILANAEARLRKITGKGPENSFLPTGDVEMEPVKTGQNGSCAHLPSEPEEEVESRLLLPPIDVLQNHRDVLSALSEPIPETEGEEFLPSHGDLYLDERQGAPDLRTDAPLEAQASYLRFNCLLYLILGLLVRLLLYTGYSTKLFTTILVPFLLVCIPQLPKTCSRAAESTALLSLTALAGHHQNKIQLILKLISTFRTLSQFFALYLFSFILTDFILNKL